MKRAVILNVFILIFSMALHAENKGYLSESIPLFGGRTAPPVNLNSQDGWSSITSVDWDALNIKDPEEGYERKWRLHTNYELSRSSSPSTIQFRLRSASIVPVFTLPWSEGGDVKEDVYSNWYEDPEALLDEESRFLVEARFITPPRTPVNGRIFSVTLEAWDVRLDGMAAVRSPGEDVQLAYARPLPTARTDKTTTPDSQESQEAALDFALSFVDACITGDLPAYYRSQSDPVRSLDDGKAIPRYRMPPPSRIPGIGNLESYKQRFNYKLYSSETYRNLFPEWFDTSRPWIPGDGAYLFMGHQDRLSNTNPEGVDYLVFLVDTDENGLWKVVARPGN